MADRLPGGERLLRRSPPPGQDAARTVASAATNLRRGPAASPFALDIDYSTALALARLPSGCHSFAPELVAHNQRKRLLAGVALSDRDLCLANQMAAADARYVNKVTSNIIGRHRITWLVTGRRIVRHFWRR